jgi:hypothetical protein
MTLTKVGTNRRERKRDVVVVVSNTLDFTDTLFREETKKITKSLTESQTGKTSTDLLVLISYIKDEVI